MATFSAATFKTVFPEFKNTDQAIIDYWVVVCKNFVDESKWGDLYIHGLSLALGHHLVMAANNTEGVPGTESKLVSSQSVGDVSASFDTSSTVEKDAGHWNLTTYGQQYLKLARMFGGVARQL